MALLNSVPQPSDKPNPSQGRTIVYKHPEGGIVAIGPDKSCAGRLVADVGPGQNGQCFVARSPAFQLAGQGVQPAQSVTSLASVTLDALFHTLRVEGNLDGILQGWTRSEQHDIRAAGEMLDEFCRQFGERVYAAFRFSLRDNTNSAFTNLPDDEAFAVS